MSILSSLLCLCLTTLVASKHVVFESHSALPSRDWPTRAQLLADAFEGKSIFVVQLRDALSATRAHLGACSEREREKKAKKSFFRDMFLLFCF
jgi:hypothetical protein